MAIELPVVDAASLAAWCETHLGSREKASCSERGNLTCVIGTRLADGREVVVRVRPAGPRIAACTDVQRRLFESGFPCPQPLAGPAPLGDHEANAETYPGRVPAPGLRPRRPAVRGSTRAASAASSPA